MIVDTSALIAIVRNEPERDEFIARLTESSARISAANWFEATMVADGSGGPNGGRNLDEIVETARITIEPVTEAHARAARIAFRRYGRGSGSPARLNFADCVAYALSATSGEPLLFKGDDFVHTDVLRVR
ncbi:type II toxin-antitoxin system VapC family toxin [Nocardioides ginsengisoli]|uniref:Ribonuclease VapC n=1 Tax=Nocardioides ginsengisoli TaxID=363868 RepID=A0ABW3VTE3_9ACTN